MATGDSLLDWACPLVGGNLCFDRGLRMYPGETKRWNLALDGFGVNARLSVADGVGIVGRQCLGYSARDVLDNVRGYWHDDLYLPATRYYC